jgi:hypothetical protein
MEGEKIAWIIGRIPVDHQRIRDSGYAIREFYQQTALPQSIDDQPDLIIFSESGITDYSIFFKLKYFYPETTILTVPDQSPSTDRHAEEQTDADAGDTLSISRLLSAIRKIEGQ